jgi:hypothetical protein
MLLAGLGHEQLRAAHPKKHTSAKGCSETGPVRFQAGGIATPQRGCLEPHTPLSTLYSSLPAKQPSCPPTSLRLHSRLNWACMASSSGLHA